MIFKMDKCKQRWFRRKTVDWEHLEDSQLNRCLSLLDLTALGIGSTLGAGVYALTGDVANQISGPAIILSFFIAAVASVFAGLCYAEFGARVPKAGSAYVYSYITIGELVAVVIGWNLILEYIIGCSSTAKAWSNNLDALTNYKMSDVLKEYVPMNLESLNSYLDVVAFGICFLLTILLAFGIRESSMLNNFLTTINIMVIVFTIGCGLFKADIKNWNLPPPDTANWTKGTGGFAPYGASGIIKGAATCFYAFVGFDIIATSGEEAKNAQKSIPISIILCLFICFLSYFAMSAVMTLMQPYYLLDKDAPLPAVFQDVNLPIAKYIVSVGAFCGLLTSLLGSIIPMPRIIYAIASDGLIFRFLSIVNGRSKTPVIATFISGLFAGVLAMIFDLHQLIEMMSIGTLLAYTMVAASVLLLRYKPNYYCTPDENKVVPQEQDYTSTSSLTELIKTRLKPEQTSSSESTSRFVTHLTLLYVFITILDCLVITFVTDTFEKNVIWGNVIAALLSSLLVVIGVIIGRQPQSSHKLTFKVPWVPLLPCLSIFINIYLMIKLSAMTWARFGIWLILGLGIYMFYGQKHSNEDQDKGLLTNSVRQDVFSLTS